MEVKKEVEERTCPSGHKLPVSEFHAYVDLNIKDINRAITFTCPDGEKGHIFNLQKAVTSGMFSAEEANKIREVAHILIGDGLKIDAIYISRPQVERWSDELLEKYKDSLPAAKQELEKRQEKEE